MKYIKQWLVAAVVMVGMLVSGSAQAQPNRSVYHFKGLGGYTLFSGTEGCWYHEVFVQGFSNINHTAGGPPSRDAGVYLSYFNHNNCTGEESSGSGLSTEATVSGNMSKLHLSATIPVIEYSPEFPMGTARTAVVDLTFDANSTYVSRSTAHDSYSTPTERYQSHMSSRTVSADVTGTVTLDGTDLLAGLTQQYGYIFDANNGSVTITHL